MSTDATPIKCTRCRHACTRGEWHDVPSKRKGFTRCTEKTCPRCGCTSYYDCTLQVAWCWASGLIEVGDALPPDKPDGSGAIEIAGGPMYALQGHLSAVARHGKGDSTGLLLVPGVPEAEDEGGMVDALDAWLAWCGKRKNSSGVVFVKELRDAAR
ncbi:hypothetical protein SAMN05192589_107146 [Paracidovorax valerianellae]|uniref:Uncharacterized protein n=1 Tax=Paracidovorax valerianellae TaxID=187868 RepID=A0A1G6VVG6_9BURK|nr:hypothetical protein [Paracidovorax valerianellae]SDD57413.1 hypothetical protein SAMN05192589_107146 [Paracidovorax valerianellae]